MTGVQTCALPISFLLLRRHHGKKDKQNINLYHIDLYRLEGSDDIKNIGLEDIFEDTSGIFLIEWGEKHENLRSSWEVRFKVLGKDKRQIIIRRSNEIASLFHSSQ